MQSPQPNIRQSLGVLQRRGRTVEETEGVKDTTKTWCTESTDQTEVGLQKSERLSRSDLGPLCICYGCIDWYSCAPSSRRMGYLWLFCLLLGPFPFYWVTSSSLDVRLCAWSYWSLLWHISLMSLGNLLFSEGRWMEGGSGGKEVEGERLRGTAVRVCCMREE